VSSPPAEPVHDRGVGTHAEQVVVCTIVARNYLPSARLLAGSVLAQHPDAEVVVGVVDGPTARRDGPLRALGMDDIGLGGRAGREMAGIYSVRELSTAIKPWLLEHLLRTTDGPVLYLDPDIEVHAPIDGLAALADEHGVALTPHVLKPFPQDGLTPDDSAVLAAGIFNLGFIGVGRGAIESGFLDFWKSRLRLDAVDDPARMRFTDQRWVDFATCFPHIVVDDPGCNVAYWNIWGRALARTGGRVLVDGEPLRFFHYSGFDPRKPDVLSVHQEPRPRVLLSERPILADLCRGYAGRLLAEGYEEGLRVPYGWRRSPVGTELDLPARAAYRAALLAAAPGEEVPGPFDEDGGAAFADWLTLPSPSTVVPPYLLSLWDQYPDLRHAFPDVPHRRSSGRRLARWVATAPDGRAAAARSVVGSADDPYTASSYPQPGLNVVGYLHAEDGLGQVARSLVAAAGAIGLPHGAHSIHLTPSSQAHEPAAGGGDNCHDYDVDLVCANADQIDSTLELLPDDGRGVRSSAGVWFWETEVFPDRYHSAFDRLDEVWAPSRFIGAALERCGRLPVRNLPLPVPVPTWTTSLTRQDLGLPDGFLVLYVFSWGSVAERKNPAAAISAFTRAFAPGDGAHLVLKSVGGDTSVGDIEALRLANDRPDVHWFDGPVRAHRLKAMIEHCDCYLSLHRSEGFGLTMAEAMALGRPVVATAWSGNLEFMDENTAHLVPASLVPIPEHVPYYGGAGRWAEPDIEAAAGALRQVFEDPAGAAKLGVRARAHIERTRSPTATGIALEQLAAALRARTAVPA
jgi:glycosyltransferase involved in cell wall biosynthesis